jgi:hypothetical protein
VQLSNSSISRCSLGVIFATELISETGEFGSASRKRHLKNPKNIFMDVFMFSSLGLYESQNIFSCLRRFEQDEAIQEEELALGIRVPNSMCILLFKKTQELHGGGFYYCRSFTRAGSLDQDSGAESSQEL